MTELKDKFPDSIENSETALGETTVTLKKEALLQVCEFLKQEQDFDYLADLTGLDLGKETEPRFAVVYHILSLKSGQRLRLKVKTAEAVDSVTSVWRGADWFEREVFDLIGVVFNNHPYMKRIYMPDDFVGHPLRKDYPLRGE